MTTQATPVQEKAMQFLVMLVEYSDGHCYDEKRITDLGFRKTLATADKRLAVQLPYPVYATMRDGDSAEQVREDVLSELSCREIAAFVIVAEGFACGRS